MSAAWNRVKGARPIRGGRLAAVFAVALAAGCGGERRAESGAADTAASPAPVSPTDTVAAVTPDTSAQVPATRDTSAAVPAPGSSVARRSTADTSAGRSGQTAGAAQTRPAPAPKPAPAAQPRDTQATAAAPAPRQASPQRPATGADSAPAGTTSTQPQQAAQQPAAQQPGQGAPLRDEYHQAPRDTVVQAVYDGWKQYNLNCARCHGEDVLGSTIAPHLVVSLKPDGPINTKESFVQVVCAGRPEKGMPAWCPLGLEMEKIEQIYSYVKGRSAGEIGPGRPALRQEG